MLNVCTFTGRLGANPEVTETSTGGERVNFRVGCSRNYPNSSGQYLTDWIPCVAWGKTGAFIYKYFQKGDFISLVGELKTFNIEENGKTYKSFSINVISVAFCGNKRDKVSSPSFDANTTQETTAQETNVFNEFNVNEFEAVEEELPF